MAPVDVKVFTRELFKSVFIDNEFVSERIKSVDPNMNENMFKNYNKRYEEGKHDGFWYCIDVCWARETKIIPTIICLYQVFFYQNKIDEDDDFKDKVRNLMLSYVRDNYEDYEQEVKEYDQINDTDILNDEKSWWNHFG